MNKEKTTEALSFFEQHAFAIWLILWLLFGCIALIGVFFSFSRFTDANEGSPKSVFDYLNASYAAAGALFTGFAFVITYLSLKHQKDELQKQNARLEKQISIDVFSNQFREAVDELVSSRSQKIKQLIHAKQTDFEEKKKHINQSDDNEESKKSRIAAEIISHNEALREIRISDEYKATERQFCIEDFKRIKLPTTSNDGENRAENNDKVSKSNKDDVSDASAYSMIIYFYDRMEYLGFIHYTYNNSGKDKCKNDANLILDYFGYDIINTFGKLKPFVHANREESNSGNPYYHFEFLYLLAIKRKKDYIKECEDELTRISK